MTTSQESDNLHNDDTDLMTAVQIVLNYNVAVINHVFRVREEEQFVQQEYDAILTLNQNYWHVPRKPKRLLRHVVPFQVAGNLFERLLFWWMAFTRSILDLPREYINLWPKVESPSLHGRKQQERTLTEPLECCRHDFRSCHSPFKAIIEQNKQHCVGMFGHA